VSDELGTYAENTWCPGCGNFGILNAVKKAVKKLEEQGIKKETIAISAGIGCHAKIFDYLSLNGLYSIHGRSVATVTGMKMANPDLKLITFVGDGDGIGEGIAHAIFAAKRNMDVTMIIHDNSVYGLTTGQFTPTTEKGVKTPTSPNGNVEEPLNPLALMLESGATFVARGYSGKIDHLAGLIVQAVNHEGFSVIQVLQPCVTFNNTYEKYNELVKVLDKTPGSYEQALKAVKQKQKLPVGVFYKVNKPPYHKRLYGDLNPKGSHPSKKDRQEKLSKFLKKKW
jgi:2-oxoglutarate ferredoxin oxidoreductase subunit beta